MKYNRIIIFANKATKNNNLPLAIDLLQDLLKENPHVYCLI
jgi:hypothetical protein